MAMARYLVEAHVLEGRSVSELATAHGVHRSWIYKLLARYREGGYEALEPRSRRPRSCKHATPDGIVRVIVRLGGRLSQEGHDCGAHTIAHHLAQDMDEGAVRRSRRSGGSSDERAWSSPNRRRSPAAA